MVVGRPFKKGHGNLLSTEARKRAAVKISKTLKGHLVSAETKKKISEAHKGRRIPEKIRKKMSEALKRQWKEGKRTRCFSKETRRKMSEAKKGKKVNEKQLECLRKGWEWNKGKKMSEEARKKMSKAKKGKKLSEEHKEKLRLSAIEYIKEVCGGVTPYIGRHEKRILDELEIGFGYRIIRQYRVGGYFLDGYIPEINLAIEIDEKYHERIKERDVEREEFIKQKLGCQFLRIKDIK